MAMPSKWGAQPPNPKNPCRGDGTDPVANRICDSTPRYLKIDYVRVYQDLSPDSIMNVGWDPKTHPTRQWILDHLDEYEDEENKLVEVRGRAFCRTDEDCTVQTKHRRRDNRSTVIFTGRCVNQRCECSGGTWTGPRCIVPSQPSAVSFSPPLIVSVCDGSLLFVLEIASCVAMRVKRKKDAEAAETEGKVKQQQRQHYELLRRQSSLHL
ncbi:hypothetical protein PF011_g22935 [Phytophthora fragariae]|uniref:GH16 domain-containing protein n=1 Tax=Phytophthora fragariae TaxID=53985 RepID=A0A6A3ICQ3_9STRA|nr:hypothetical protein PF011_g22935 [Phytophthora fragariae]